MENYFRGDFITTGDPILNKEVEILFSIKQILEAPNTSISVYLPEGIELVHGDIHWEGNTLKDEVVQITFTVKPIQEGQLVLWSYVESVFSSKHTEHHTYYLVFLTSKDSGQISRTSFYPPSVESNPKLMTVGLV